MPSSRWTFVRIMAKARRLVRNEHIVLSVLALVVGSGAGLAVIGFREAISYIQALGFGTDSERLYLHLQQMAWWQIVLVPTVGGLVVGLMVRYLLPERHTQGVADVIEASVVRGGAMSSRVGLASALASAVSIGSGASVGREGPAVHLGASLAGWLARRFHLPRSLGRSLLGCGVASAVAASFNAPIAGALFAGEVVVGHYALKAFAPVVIASVAGTAVSRSWFGDFPAFALDTNILASFWEFPGFLLLGLVCGVGAIAFMRGIETAGRVANKVPGPAFVRPAIAGFAVGLIALAFPQVLGVGYGATEAALVVAFPLWMFVCIGLAKGLATAVSLGFGFSGGVFSPSLVLGAMVGASYGILATWAFPDLSSGPAAYTLVGMGAFAAAVLGAPISTTLIIFEMTGDYALTLGVMVAVVAATEVTHHGYGKSFFIEQLRARGLDLQGEFEAEALRSARIGEVMDSTTPPVGAASSLAAVRTRLANSPWAELFVTDTDGKLRGTIMLSDLHDKAFDADEDGALTAADVARLHPPILSVDDDLEAALAVMRQTGEDHIAVVHDTEAMTYAGCVHQRDVMNAYTRALLRARKEEHDETA